MHFHKTNNSHFSSKFHKLPADPPFPTANSLHKTRKHQSFKSTPKNLHFDQTKKKVPFPINSTPITPNNNKNNKILKSKKCAPENRAEKAVTVVCPEQGSVVVVVLLGLIGAADVVRAGLVGMGTAEGDGEECAGGVVLGRGQEGGGGCHCCRSIGCSGL